MKSKKKKIIAFAVTALSSLLLFSSCRYHSNRSEFAFDYVTEVLNLDEQQQKKLDDIKKEIMAEIDAMQNAKDDAHITLKEQLSSESIDKQVIAQLVQDHRSQMDRILDLSIDKFVDFHADLSPEQRAKLVAKLEKIEKRHGRCFSR